MDLAWIAPEIGARDVRRTGRIQSLWAGVGELFRISIVDGPAATAVVKWARPPGGERDPSTLRKVRSFAVETAFYKTLAPRCDDTCRVPALLAARGGADEGGWFLVLEDLDAAGFTERADNASETQLDSMLAWLAGFHARFLGERPAEVWPRGTYWHLDTRRDELAAIRDPALRASAEELDAQLRAARYQTLLHGDAKDENFCFSRDGTRVAAVDFQYTGPGPGIVDVVYLLYAWRDKSASGADRQQLERYFAYLRRELARRGEPVDADALEAEWRALAPVARRDFQRFLAGWRG